MDKIIGSHIKLETFFNDFLNELANCIEKYDRPECFGRVIQFLVGFWDNDHSRSFEMRRLISYFDTSVSNADNEIETVIIFENDLQMTLRQLIRTRSRQIIAVG